jgi:UDP-3-O-[3-hydroxymyristoyl] glucosamine N-acyltransferase
MENKKKGWTLREIGQILGAEWGGGEDVWIDSAAQIDSQNSNGLAFAESDAYLAKGMTSGVGAVIVPTNTPEYPKPFLRHPHPRRAFGQFLNLVAPQFDSKPGVHPTAVIHPTAQIHETAHIGAMVFIGENSVIEAEVCLMPFAYVGENCTLRNGVRVFPHATLVRNVMAEAHAEIGPGAVIGHAGFGYYFDGETQVAIPQVGGVELGEGVHIGALTAVDRATADNTVVGKGTKLDNLVQIGHNVRIGANGVFASQAGVAGSTTIGERVVVAGQVGFSDHLTIPDNTTIGARSAVLSNIDKPGVYAGMPLVPMGDFLRTMAIQKDLPKLMKRIRALEKKIAELEA